MKVIAVMTMAFLPATSIAAVFAVPSLQWGLTPVMQDNFWIYWAFTLPATAMVFALWFIFSKGSSLWRSVSLLARTAQGALHQGSGNNQAQDGEIGTTEPPSSAKVMASKGYGHHSELFGTWGQVAEARDGSLGVARRTRT